jgi:hypothetical protein
VAKAASKDSLKALAKLTRTVDGTPEFIDDPPVLSRLEDLVGPEEATRFRASAAALVRSYKASLPDDRRVLIDRYRFVDIARKVVGVGSVGTRAWVVLMLGRDGDDPLMLQVKEAQASVLEAHVGPSMLAPPGRRVVAGQRLTQAGSDVFLGWGDGARSGNHYYVRQLWDVKGQSDPMVMDAVNLAYYGALCGWALARAHARTGDPVMISGYLGGSDRFDRAVAAFAEHYAIVNARDHATFLTAIKDGDVEAS